MEAVLAGDYTPSDRIAYEYFVKGSEPSKVSKKYDKLDKPSNLNINYDQVSNSISVNWNYDEGSLDNVSFMVSQSIDEGPFQVVNTSKNMAYEIADVIPGAIYSFQVVAVSDNGGGNQSNVAATKIQVPEPEVDIPELPEDAVEGDEEKDKEKEKDKDKDNNGNGNGNGKDDNIPEEEDGVDIIPEENEEGEQTIPSTDASTPPQNNTGKEEDTEQTGDDGEEE
jgi:penicillin-binding protein 1A